MENCSSVIKNSIWQFAFHLVEPTLEFSSCLLEHKTKDFFNWNWIGPFRDLRICSRVRSIFINPNSQSVINYCVSGIHKYHLEGQNCSRWENQTAWSAFYDSLNTRSMIKNSLQWIFDEIKSECHVNQGHFTPLSLFVCLKLTKANTNRH